MMKSILKNKTKIKQKNDPCICTSLLFIYCYI